MGRNLITISFIFILTTVITMPAVLNILDSDCDISIFFDAGEEEEKDKKPTEDLEIKIIQVYFNELGFINLDSKHLSNGYSNSYNSVYRQIFSPPPETQIL